MRKTFVEKNCLQLKRISMNINEKEPVISVVLPTYNASVPFLKEAVDSILNQSFQDFELIIVDDGSTDETPAYLSGLSDLRVRVIRNDVNLGTTKSLNIGFREARGEYIARMDSDDISRADRFEKQLAFMESHPDVIVCGAQVTRRQEDLLPGGTDTSADPGRAKEPEDMEGYRIRMLFRNPGPAHPTAFFRRDALLCYHILYDEGLRYAQDYDLWMRISRHGRICVLPETLLFFRSHGNRISKLFREEQIRCDKITQRKLLSCLVDYVSEREAEVHYLYSTAYYHGLPLTREVISWYRKLIRANAQRHVYDQRKLRRAVNSILFRIAKEDCRTKIRKATAFLRGRT